MAFCCPFTNTSSDRSFAPGATGQNVLRHTGIGGTLPLSKATVATNPTGEVQLTGTGTRVHSDWLADDEAIGDELADGLAGVGVGDLVDLIGIEPDLALAAAEDVSREALLSSQVDPIHAKSGQSALHFFLIGTLLHRDEMEMELGVSLEMGRQRMKV